MATEEPQTQPIHTSTSSLQKDTTHDVVHNEENEENIDEETLLNDERIQLEKERLQQKYGKNLSKEMIRRKLLKKVCTMRIVFVLFDPRSILLSSDFRFQFLLKSELF